MKTISLFAVALTELSLHLILCAPAEPAGGSADNHFIMLLVYHTLSSLLPLISSSCCLSDHSSGLQTLMLQRLQSKRGILYYFCGFAQYTNQTTEAPVCDLIKTEQGRIFFFLL